MKKRYPKARVRQEFLHLEAQLEPDFEKKAMRQFYDALIHGNSAERSYQDQFKLVARIQRAHARRDRYNSKRRMKRLEEIAPFFCPEYFTYIAAGLIKTADWRTGEWRPELTSGAAGLDIRHTRKLLEECEVVREMLEPRVPLHQIDRERARAEVDAPARVDAERTPFVELLKPTPIPVKEESVVVFQYPKTDSNNITKFGEAGEKTDHSNAA
ncbi:MAG: hypothetical protein ACI8UO_006464 [Verrucomicrobiales bacterium]|jgi:hypothetical protein